MLGSANTEAACSASYLCTHFQSLILQSVGQGYLSSLTVGFLQPEQHFLGHLLQLLWEELNPQG